MFTITVPNPDFSGDRLGLQFTRGQATTDDIELANLFKSFDGYTVTKAKPKKAKAEPAPAPETEIV
jgi:hypothetical protein